MEDFTKIAKEFFENFEVVKDEDAEIEHENFIKLLDKK